MLIADPNCFFLFLTVMLGLTRDLVFNPPFSTSAFRFLLPPQLVPFHLSAPGGDQSRPLQPGLLLLVRGLWVGPPAGGGDDRLHCRTSDCTRHPAGFGEGCGVVAYHVTAPGC